MPKVKKERTKYHHAAKKADSSDDEDLKELGLVFKSKEIFILVFYLLSPAAKASSIDGESFLWGDARGWSNVNGVFKDELSKLDFPAWSGWRWKGNLLLLDFVSILLFRMWRKRKEGKPDESFLFSDWIFLNRSSRIWKIMCKWSSFYYR